MTHAEFACEMKWLGWEAFATRAFNLRPAEVHALGQMMRHPGRAVVVDTLAAWEGKGTGTKGLTGSRNGIAKRIERVRAKLADVECKDVVLTLCEHRTGPTIGYVIPPAAAQQIHNALLFACGVDEAAEATA